MVMHPYYASLIFYKFKILMKVNEASYDDI